jgi:integrase
MVMIAPTSRNVTLTRASQDETQHGAAVRDCKQLLREWNTECQPPWSEKELEHKIDDALKQPDGGDLSATNRSQKATLNKVRTIRGITIRIIRSPRTETCYRWNCGLCGWCGTFCRASSNGPIIDARRGILRAKGFTKWLSANQKLARDPLVSVQKPNPKTDRRRERRMLLPDEWQWLQATAPHNQYRYGMPAAERVLLYAVAIQTGLRSSELRSLTRGRLFLDVDKPFITCKAGSTKNGMDARQYITTDLASELRGHVARKAPRAPVFAMPADYDVAEMLRADLADARREWMKSVRYDPVEYARREQSDFLVEVNHDGERLDFHSLRHTCGAWLAKSGAHAKTVQAVMRHSSITLTMDTYGHLFPGQEAEAVAQFSKMMAGDCGALMATGTVDSAAKPTAQRHAQQLGRDSLPSNATSNESLRNESHRSNCPNPLHVAAFGDAMRDNAKQNESSGGWIRTNDPRLMNPLL